MLVELDHNTCADARLLSSDRSVGAVLLSIAVRIRDEIEVVHRLHERIGRGSQVHMVLSADLDARGIDALAAQNGIGLAEVHRGRQFGEAQVVYRLALRTDIDPTG